MKIMIVPTSKDEVEAFLSITKKGKGAQPASVYRYHISPLGIHMEHPFPEMLFQEDSRQKKSPVHIAVSTADCVWEEGVQMQGTLIHGVMKRREATGKSSGKSIGKFSFSFGEHKKRGKPQRDELYEAMQRDPVTRTYHPQYLMNLLKWEIEKYEHQQQRANSIQPPISISLLQIEISRLKEHMSMHGELGVDAILHEVASRLQARLRQIDILSRWDDGFMIFLPHTTEEQANGLATAFRKYIEKRPIHIQKDNSIYIKVSIRMKSYQDSMNAYDFIEQIKKKPTANSKPITKRV